MLHSELGWGTDLGENLIRLWGQSDYRKVYPKMELNSPVHFPRHTCSKTKMRGGTGAVIEGVASSGSLLS